MQVLGLTAKPEAATEEPGNSLSDAQIESLIEQRTEARRTKNFEQGDRLRQQLQAAGITLIDQPDGQTRWHR